MTKKYTNHIFSNYIRLRITPGRKYQFVPNEKNKRINEDTTLVTKMKRYAGIRVVRKWDCEDFFKTMKLR